MLGVFRKDVNKPDPLSPDLPGPDYIPALKDGYLEKYFASVYSHSVIVNLGNFGFMAYSTDKNLSPSPTPLFCMRGGIYCIYRGRMKMMKERKNAGDKGNELDMLIACYADLIKKGNQTPLEVMQVLCGDYNYILFDSFATTKGSLRGSIAVNCWEDMSLYYGLDSEGCCIIADDTNIMKVCGDSFKFIPKGYALLIPVLIDTNRVPIQASSSDDSGSETESAGEPTEAKSSNGINLKTTSSEGKIGGSSSGGSESMVVDPKGDVSTADNPSAGSSLKTDTDASEPSAASPADGISPKKESGILPNVASN